MPLHPRCERRPGVCAAAVMKEKPNRSSILSVLLVLCGLLSLQSCCVFEALLDDDDCGSHSSCQSQPHFSHPYYDPCCHGHHR
jgi:hypothetical protein